MKPVFILLFVVFTFVAFAQARADRTSSLKYPKKGNESVIDTVDIIRCCPIIVVGSGCPPGDFLKPYVFYPTKVDVPVDMAIRHYFNICYWD